MKFTILLYNLQTFCTFPSLISWEYFEVHCLIQYISVPKLNLGDKSTFKKLSFRVRGFLEKLYFCNCYYTFGNCCSWVRKKGSVEAHKENSGGWTFFDPQLHLNLREKLYPRSVYFSFRFPSWLALTFISYFPLYQQLRGHFSASSRTPPVRNRG